MTATRHLTFANVASALALAIALAGGGAAAAGSLGKNSVGSKQIRNDAVTGKDVKESSLKTVPSAASAQSAASAADSLDVLRATIDENGQLLPLSSEGAVKAQTYLGGEVVVVTFDRSIIGCSVTGSSYSTQSTTYGRFVEVSSGAAAPTAVLARAWELDGDSFSGPLNIVVVC